MALNKRTQHPTEALRSAITQAHSSAHHARVWAEHVVWRKKQKK